VIRLSDEAPLIRYLRGFALAFLPLATFFGLVL
jgi:hypothetical protein